MIEVDFGIVTAIGPLAVRMKGDSTGYVVPVFGATGWTPVAGFEVAVLVRVEGGRRTAICCIGPRNPI